MRSRLLAAGLVTIMLPLGAAACGADSTGELNRGEVSEKLQEEVGLDAETADCAADALIDADFTDEELESAESLEGAKGEAFAAAMAECRGIDPSLLEGATDSTN